MGDPSITQVVGGVFALMLNVAGLGMVVYDQRERTRATAHRRAAAAGLQPVSKSLVIQWAVNEDPEVTALRAMTPANAQHVAEAHIRIEEAVNDLTRRIDERFEAAINVAEEHATALRDQIERDATESAERQAVAGWVLIAGALAAGFTGLVG